LANFSKGFYVLNNSYLFFNSTIASRISLTSKVVSYF
jgi:hypothetical protein